MNDITIINRLYNNKIIVVVVMDFIAQAQSHLMSHQYEGLMKKSKFKGFTG